MKSVHLITILSDSVSRIVSELLYTWDRHWCIATFADEECTCNYHIIWLCVTQYFWRLVCSSRGTQAICVEHTLIKRLHVLFYGTSAVKKRAFEITGIPYRKATSTKCFQVRVFVSQQDLSVNWWHMQPAYRHKAENENNADRLDTYCKSGNFREIFIFANSVKRHTCDLKIAARAWFNYISSRQSDFAILRGFYFHETSHMRSFGKIKPSRKFPNLQYSFLNNNDNLQRLSIN